MTKSSSQHGPCPTQACQPQDWALLVCMALLQSFVAASMEHDLPATAVTAPRSRAEGECPPCPMLTARRKLAAVPQRRGTGLCGRERTACVVTLVCSTISARRSVRAMHIVKSSRVGRSANWAAVKIHVVKAIVRCIDQAGDNSCKCMFCTCALAFGQVILRTSSLPCSQSARRRGKVGHCIDRSCGHVLWTGPVVPQRLPHAAAGAIAARRGTDATITRLQRTNNQPICCFTKHMTCTIRQPATCAHERASHVVRYGPDTLSASHHSQGHGHL